MRKTKSVALLIAISVLAPAPAWADGFSSAHTQQFRVNSAGRDLTIEAMRINQNAAARSGASGAANGQGNSNMANVIQITENYNMVLNGDNNSLNTTGSTVKGQQDGGGLAQTADNQIQTNSDSTVANSSSARVLNDPWQINP